MKRHLSLVGAGLIALGTLGQQSITKKIEKTEPDRQRREAIQAAADYYVSSANGYIRAASNRLSVANQYHSIVAPTIKRIESGVETNYPSAWIKVATYEMGAGSLEKQVGENYSKARGLLEKAYNVSKELDEDRISLLWMRDGLNYTTYWEMSRKSYETAKKHFEDAGDEINASVVIELIAGDDEKIGNLYNTSRK